jgi:hypothetical protein
VGEFLNRQHNGVALSASDAGRENTLRQKLAATRYRESRRNRASRPLEECSSRYSSVRQTRNKNFWLFFSRHLKSPVYKCCHCGEFLATAENVVLFGLRGFVYTWLV